MFHYILKGKFLVSETPLFSGIIACEPVKLLMMAPPNLLDISEFLLRYVAAVPREMWPENWRPLSASRPTSSWTWNAATHAETETLAWTSLQLACTQYPGSWLHHSSLLLGGLISVKNSKLSPNKRSNSSALIVPPSKSILDLADLRKCGWRILESIISIWIEIYTDISCTDALNYPITYICLKFYWYILNQNENHIDINCTDRCDYLDIYQNFYIDIKSYI